MPKQHFNENEPPVALHALAQPLVNRLWDEGRTLRSAAAALLNSTLELQLEQHLQIAGYDMAQYCLVPRQVVIRLQQTLTNGDPQA